MTTAARMLASISWLALLAGAAAAQGTYRTVAIPDVAPGALCVEQRLELIGRAQTATAAAAENVQTVSRLLAERQAALRGDPATLAPLRAERDRRTDEWRRAEAALDAASRIDPQDCAPPRQAQADEAEPPAVAETPLPSPPPGPVNERRAAGVGPGPAPTLTPSAPPPPPAQAQIAAQIPARPGAPALSLAVGIDAPQRCQASEPCNFTVSIENLGARALGSPLLAAVALGFDGGTVATVTPESWSCGRGGENLTCASGGLSLEPGATTRFRVEWRLPERLRRPSATVCARIVWPGQAAGGIYRGEQIAAVQYALQRAGFDTGGVEGRMGPRTLEAIRQVRSRAGIQGGTGITRELIDNLFGANGALTGDDDASNDSACTAVTFGETPVASAPAALAPARRAPPAAAAAPPPPAEEPDEEVARDEPVAAPPPPVREALPRRPRAEPPPRQEARRRPPVVTDEDEDDDDVVIYRSPRRAAPRYERFERYERRGTVVYGPNGPVVVYPGPPMRPWGGYRW